MTDTPKPVSMTAISHHTYNAITREPGEVYDVDPFYADTLITLNFARRTEHMTGKKKAAPAASAPVHVDLVKPAAAAVPTKSTK